MSTMTDTADNGDGGGVEVVAPSTMISPDSKHSSGGDSSVHEVPADEGEEHAFKGRPKDVALFQQRMKAWQPLLDPKWVIAAYLMIGIIFIPTGVVIRNKSDNLIELKTIYESHLKDGPAADVTGCEIGDNPNQMFLADPQQTCQIQMTVPSDRDMEPPVLVHYEIDNFYQNYRRYFFSRDQYQLFGSLSQSKVSADECAPLNEINGIKINPCGLIANTLFNDVIQLDSIVGPDGEVIENAPLVETGIAWASDLEWKYRQPEGFTSEQCASCDECDCTEEGWSCREPYVDEDGNCWRYYYPMDDTTQYLYETYPMVVSPLDGVLNEHFVVWMRTAALPHFRKLYGYIEQPIPAGSTLTFSVQANWAVQRFEGAKGLVVSESYIFGGKNHWLGTLFIIVGSIAGGLGLLFLAKEVIKPRKMGDRNYLKFKEE
ncbi:hypothetical protein ACHAXT_009572 [Thalassiosira profunda]